MRCFGCSVKYSFPIISGLEFVSIFIDQLRDRVRSSTNQITLPTLSETWPSTANMQKLDVFNQGINNWAVHLVFFDHWSLDHIPPNRRRPRKCQTFELHQHGYERGVWTAWIKSFTQPVVR